MIFKADPEQRVLSTGTPPPRPSTHHKKNHKFSETTRILGTRTRETSYKLADPPPIYMLQKRDTLVSVGFSARAKAAA